MCSIPKHSKANALYINKHSSKHINKYKLHCY